MPVPLHRRAVASQRRRRFVENEKKTPSCPRKRRRAAASSSPYSRATSAVEYKTMPATANPSRTPSPHCFTICATSAPVGLVAVSCSDALFIRRVMSCPFLEDVPAVLGPLELPRVLWGSRLAQHPRAVSVDSSSICFCSSRTPGADTGGTVSTKNV